MPEYLHDEGYRIILGVNPQFTSEEVFGEKVRASLAEIKEPVDLVDVFVNSRRDPGACRGHSRDATAAKVVWFQLGIKNEDAARLSRMPASPSCRTAARLQIISGSGSARRGRERRARPGA